MTGRKPHWLTGGCEVLVALRSTDSNTLMAMPANHATARTARAGPKTSGTRTPSVPTLAQMIRDGQTDAIKHKQRSRDALGPAMLAHRSLRGH
jgi:hypothetical protein